MRTTYVWLSRLGTALLAVFTISTVAVTQPAQTRELSEEQVQELIDNADTPREHELLSRHFAAVAERYEADAARHTRLAARYRKAPTASETKRPMSPDTAAHCERFAKLAGDAAKEAKSLADLHARLAKSK